MAFGSTLYHYLDLFLIAPFRWPGPDAAIWGMWMGSIFLAFYCTVIGELIGAVLFLIHRKHYLGMQDKMTRYHNISVGALHAGDKETYLAANKLANDDFGKNFFAQASVGVSTLLPIPFALGWMSKRFEGIEIYSIPGTSISMGYVFVLLSSYIVIRILFSRFKKHLPLFRRVLEIKEKARKERGPMRSFFNPEKPEASEEESGEKAAGSEENTV